MVSYERRMRLTVMV